MISKLFEHLKQEIQLLHDRFESAEKPKPVPMLPDKLTIWELENRLEEQKQPYDIPVGLDEESVAPVYFDLKKNKHCLIIGQTQRGKTNVTKLMLDQLLAAKPESWPSLIRLIGVSLIMQKKRTLITLKQKMISPNGQRK